MNKPSKPAATATTTAAPGTPRDDDTEEPWRHPPRAAKDESPAASLGRAVSEVVTGPGEDASGEPQPDLTGTRRNPSR